MNGILARILQLLTAPFRRRHDARRGSNAPRVAGPQRLAKRIWRIMLGLVFGLFFLIFAVQYNFLWLFGRSPSLESLEKPKLSQASFVYSADGKLIGRYFRENRIPVKYDKISKHVIDALLATEDIRFFEHSGIDPEAMVSVAAGLAKGDARGGSTITQQLAKNLYKTRTKDSKGLLGGVPGVGTFIIKLKEWITAVKLERNYSKREILELYLNTVDFGSNSYGINTASRFFFNKTPDKLKVEEAAMLVGMLKATTSYNPKRNYGKALARRNTVLAQMMKYGVLPKARHDSLTKLPIVLHEPELYNPDGPQDYYNQALVNELQDRMDQLREDEDKDLDFYTDGLRIYITIDSRMQQYARDAVAEHMKDLQGRFESHWGKQNPWVDDKNREIPGYFNMMLRRTEAWKAAMKRFKGDTASVMAEMNRKRPMLKYDWKTRTADTLQWTVVDSLKYYKRLLHCSIFAVEPGTGQVKAWVGGRDYNFFKYDHVKQSMRQPGSTFKAFVYATAMEKGYTPCSKVQDAYKAYEYDEIEDGQPVHKKWAPVNAAGYYTGMNISLRYAIGRSINSVAARLTNDLNPDTVAETARRIGISSPIKPIKMFDMDKRQVVERRPPSIGLGSIDVTLFEMVGAYATFVNQGLYTKPMLVSRLEDINGNVIKQFSATQRRAITAKSAYLMIHMLRGTMQEPGGTAQGLYSYRFVIGNEVAGKTGTSSNQSDGWFVGFTPQLVAGVWVGAEERSVHFRTLRMGEGAKTALPIFGKFMDKVYADTSLGYRKSRFPKMPKWILRKDYICPTILPKVDTASSDSTAPRLPTKEDSIMGPPAPKQEIIPF